MTKRFGFTLAEVLITLGIIGVVAAMTIPTLMNSTGQAEFKTGFKKAISSLNQAITMNVALADTDFTTLTTGTTGLDGSIANMFMTRLNVVKSIDLATDTAAGGIDNGTIAVPVANATNYTIFMNDGSAIGIKAASATCLDNVYNINCAAIVDVNGPKKPNRLTNCGVGTAAATETGTGAAACTKTNLTVGDRFSIRFLGNQVQPNGNGARYVMYN